MPTESAPRAGETKTGPKARPEYSAAREAFEKLESAEKAAFLLESAFGAAGELVAEAARAVADVVERAGQTDFWTTSPDDGAKDAPPPRARKRGAGAAEGSSPDTSWGEPLSDSEK